jgi:hypothetical protein
VCGPAHTYVQSNDINLEVESYRCLCMVRQIHIYNQRLSICKKNLILVLNGTER